MSFTAVCPFCGARYPDVDEHNRAQRARCKRCNNVFLAYPDNAAHQALREKATRLKLPFVRVLAVPLDLGLVAAFPREVLNRCVAVPIGRAGDDLLVALGDPADIMLLDDLRRHRPKVKFALGPADEITEALSRLPSEAEIAAAAQAKQLEAVGGSALAAQALRELEELAARDEIETETMEEVADTSPAKRAIDNVLTQAIEEKASEVRIMEREGVALAQARTADGLKAIATDANVPYSRFIGRLKDMAGCDPTKKGEEQNGSIPFRRGDAEYEFLLQIVPAANSERAALRVFEASMMRQRRMAERRAKVDSLLDGLHAKVWPPAGLGVDPTTSKDWVTDYLEDEPAIARLAYSVIFQAVDKRHRDLVIEPHQDGLRTLSRNLGEPNFEPLMTLPHYARKPLLARLKIMSNIDLGRGGDVQHGMFTIFRGGQGYECRVATMPTEAGRDSLAVIHIVPPGIV